MSESMIEVEHKTFQEKIACIAVTLENSQANGRMFSSAWSCLQEV